MKIVEGNIEVGDLNIRLVILDFNEPEEVNKYTQLFENCFGKRPNIDASMFRWFNASITNEQAMNHNFGLIDLATNKLIAAYGLLPLNSHLSGKIQQLSLCTNVMTDPDYGGRGLFKKIGEWALAYMEAQKGQTIGLGIPNANAIRGHLRIGWQEVPSVCFFEKSNFEQKSRTAFEKHSHEQINLFSEDQDDLIHKFHKKYTFFVEKNHAILNWRYLKPYQEYYKIIIKSNQKFSGYFVYKIFVDHISSQKKMHLLDFAYNDLEDLEYLLSVATEKAIEHKVDLINLWLFDVENLEISAFKKIDFIKTDQTNKVILYSKLDFQNQNFAHFHLTLGDNDVF